MFIETICIRIYILCVMPHYRIRDLNKDEKPREKLIQQEAGALTNEELLAIILRSGGKGITAIELARNLLRELGGIRGLQKSDIKKLLEIKNINTAKATSLKAACEMGLRITSNTQSEVYIEDPKKAYELIKKDVFQKGKEYLYLLSLNSKNKLLAKDLISIGTVNATLVHPREIFKMALLRDAVTIILVHNHPSNDPIPSKEDLKVTQKVIESGKNIGVPLVDHIIVCDDSFFSMKSKNLLPK